MSTPDWNQWLSAHRSAIEAFVDLELEPREEAKLAEILGKFWFRFEGWNGRGYRFLSLGQDGTGSELALWVRPGQDAPPPVVFFGSEGGAGVLARDLPSFLQALAHAPGIEEYPLPSHLVAQGSWMFDFDSDGSAKRAQEAYRADVEAAFGRIAPFPELVSGVAEANEELGDWVVRGQQGLEIARQKEEAARARTREEIAEELKSKQCPSCGSSDLLLLKSTEIRAACRSCRHLFDPLVLVTPP